MMMNHELLEEAYTFDQQIRQRLENGHIPDLRRTQKCEWFYNNPWRHPEYVKLTFGEIVDVILFSLQKFGNPNDRLLLEVGCGPGQIALELARNGYNVTGIDLSAESIVVAKHFADDDPWKKERGELNYITGDFLACPELFPDAFDALIFVGSLHHFPDQHAVMQRACALLKKHGMVIIHEPGRDNITKGNAAMMYVIRLLLSLAQGYYTSYPIPDNRDELEQAIEAIYHELTYTDNQGKPVQSVHDNSAGLDEMRSALQQCFQELWFQESYALLPELIGGLRFNEEMNIALAKALRDIDHVLCRYGVLRSARFFFVGKNILK